MSNYGYALVEKQSFDSTQPYVEIAVNYLSYFDHQIRVNQNPTSSAQVNNDAIKTEDMNRINAEIGAGTITAKEFIVLASAQDLGPLSSVALKRCPHGIASNKLACYLAQS